MWGVVCLILVFSGVDAMYHSDSLLAFLYIYIYIYIYIVMHFCPGTITTHAESINSTAVDWTRLQHIQH